MVQKQKCHTAELKELLPELQQPIGLPAITGRHYHLDTYGQASTMPED